MTDLIDLTTRPTDMIDLTGLIAALFPARLARLDDALASGDIRKIARSLRRACGHTRAEQEAMGKMEAIYAAARRGRDYRDIARLVAAVTPLLHDEWAVRWASLVSEIVHPADHELGGRLILQLAANPRLDSYVKPFVLAYFPE